MVDWVSQHADTVAAIAAAAAAIAAAVGVGINTRYQRKQDVNMQRQLALAQEEAEERKDETQLNREELDRIRRRDEKQEVEKNFQELFSAFYELDTASDQLTVPEKSQREFSRYHGDFLRSLALFKFRANFLNQEDSVYLGVWANHLQDLHVDMAQPSGGFAAGEEDKALAQEWGVDAETEAGVRPHSGNVFKPKMSDPFYWDSPTIIHAFQEESIGKIFSPHFFEGGSEVWQPVAHGLEKKFREDIWEMRYVSSMTNPPQLEPPHLTREEAHLDAFINYRGRLSHKMGIIIELLSSKYLGDLGKPPVIE